MSAKKRTSKTGSLSKKKECPEIPLKKTSILVNTEENVPECTKSPKSKEILDILEGLRSLTANLRDTGSLNKQVTRRALIKFVETVDVIDVFLTPGRTKRSRLRPEARVLAIVKQRIIAALASLGVQPMEQLAGLVDFTMHDVITTVPTTDVDADGTIAEVIQEGYLLGTDVLRQAKVTVFRMDTSETQRQCKKSKQTTK